MERMKWAISMNIRASLPGNSPRFFTPAVIVRSIMNTLDRSIFVPGHTAPPLESIRSNKLDEAGRAFWTSPVVLRIAARARNRSREFATVRPSSGRAPHLSEISTCEIIPWWKHVASTCSSVTRVRLARIFFFFLFFKRQKRSRFIYPGIL